MLPFFCILNCLPFFSLPFFPDLVRCFFPIARILPFFIFQLLISLFCTGFKLPIYFFSSLFFCRFHLLFFCRLFFVVMIFAVFLRYFRFCSFYLSFFFRLQFLFVIFLKKTAKKIKNGKKTNIAQKNTMICYAELILSPLPSDLN